MAFIKYPIPVQMPAIMAKIHCQCFSKYSPVFPTFVLIVNELEAVRTHFGQLFCLS
jgi:hypothetical protein